MEQIESFLRVPNDERPFSVQLAGVSFPDPDYRISRECSDIWVLEYVISGEGTVITGDAKYSICAGDAYILPKGSKHLYFSSPDDPWKKIWMNVDGGLCDALTQLYSLSGVCVIPAAGVGPLFEEFLLCCRDRSQSTDKTFSRCAVIFHRIIQRLASCLAGDSADPLALSAREYIDAHAFEKLTAAGTAHELGLSVSQLGRIFKREFSTTVYSYILGTKLDTAKNLLRSTSLPVREISLMLCFPDEHYFSNIFRKKCGTTPAAYRKTGQ